MFLPNILYIFVNVNVASSLATYKVVPFEVGPNSPFYIILWFFVGLRIIILDLFLRSWEVDKLFIVP